MFSSALTAKAKKLLRACEGQGIMIASAESCTGGLIAALLTEIPGSSLVFERGFVTYSNAAKAELLGVPSALIKRHGAVSPEVAQAMAEGALKHSKAHMALAVTGIAGPGGGTHKKPVGLVYIAVAVKKDKSAVIHEWRFKGNRSAIRMEALHMAVSLLTARLIHSS